MYTPEQIAYVQQELSLGEPPEQIYSKLVASGWSETEAQNLISIASHPSTEQHISSSQSTLQYIWRQYNSLLSESLQAYRNSLKTYLGIQFIQLLVIIIVLVLLFIVPGLFLSSILKIQLVFGRQIPTSILLFILGGTGILLASYIFTIPSLALLYAISDETHIMHSRDYFRKAIFSVWKIWLIGIFSGFIIGISVLIALPFFLLGELFNYSYGIQILFKVIGVILAAIAFLHLLSQIFFATYIFVNENVGVLESFRRSRLYTRHNLIKILLHIVVLGIALSITNFIPLIGPIVDLFVFFPLGTIYFFKIYKNIKMQTPV